MQIALEQCEIRPYSLRDAPDLARRANNRKVWRNLRDAFPHPYTLDHAEAFISRVTEMDPQTNWCIAVDGRAAGGIGLKLHEDVERFSAELGYWLAEEFWGRGITSAAVSAVSDHALQAFGLNRIFAEPYAWNPASCRVLEKAGFQREGVLRRAAFKDGQVVDKFMYARIRAGA